MTVIVFLIRCHVPNFIKSVQFQLVKFADILWTDEYLKTIFYILLRYKPPELMLWAIYKQQQQQLHSAISQSCLYVVWHCVLLPCTHIYKQQQQQLHSVISRSCLYVVRHCVLLSRTHIYKQQQQQLHSVISQSCLYVVWHCVLLSCTFFYPVLVFKVLQLSLKPG